MRKKSNAERRVSVEAAAKNRASAKIQGANRYREEDEARAKAGGEIWEKVEKTRI